MKRRLSWKWPRTHSRGRCARGAIAVSIGEGGELLGSSFSIRLEGTPPLVLVPPIPAGDHTVALESTGAARIVVENSVHGSTRLDFPAQTTRIHPDEKVGTRVLPYTATFFLLPDGEGGIAFCGTALRTGCLEGQRLGLYAQLAPAPAFVRDCSAAEAAFEEVFLRLKATRLALERERNLHSYLDQAHEDLRQSIYAGSGTRPSHCLPVGECWIC